MKRVILFIIIAIFAASHGMENMYAGNDTSGKQVIWDWVYLKDGMIEEKVLIYDLNWNGDRLGWSMQTNEDHVILTRTCTDFSNYLYLEDRLPIALDVDNYIVLKVLSISNTEYLPKEESLYRQVRQSYPIQLKFQLPGDFFVSKEGLDEQDSITIEPSEKESSIKEINIRGYHVSGLWFSLALFSFGFMGICIIYYTYVRRAERIINEDN